ncbi:DUF4091 domain-containing protein [Lacipirellula sp.]|uniref:DUF4091 domain-containing protein n=1 Tax=Lacipirellula sp. TaxID=2691419 RepID=UPI003D0C19C9
MQRRDMLRTLAAGTAAVGVSAAAPAAIALAAASADRAGAPLEKEGVKFWTETSLKRIFPNTEPGSAAELHLTSARNAQLSFQLAFRNLRDCSIRVRAAVEAPEGWSVRVRRVGYVPIAQLDTDIPVDELDGVGQLPGLAPDPLFPEETAHIGPSSNGAFWITLHIPPDAQVGANKLVAKLTIEDEFRFPQWMGVPPQSVELPVSVDVRPLVLEKRKDFPVTHWISADSIWEYYKTEPFSERFWELADAYVADLTAHNLNVVYSPIFNARHELLERPAQLLKVRRVDEHEYEFDFSDVRRWIKLAKKNNAEYLEWTHFFTPAPTSGKHPQRIYERWGTIGKLLWPPETSATSKEYRSFLEQFIPQFKQVLEEEGVLDCSLFHCADEPDGHVQVTDYRQARALLRELAPWMKVMDALSEPLFATERITDMPIPSIVTAHHFVEAGCPAWVYFCCGPRGRYLQRFHDTPLPKLRMAGWLFYKLKAQGFLHWGHNYWFVFCTGTPINPFLDAATGAWPGMPHGDAFVVYPGDNGPIDSIRWEVFAESLQDYAMLQTAGIDPDDSLLAQLKSYEIFPKQEAWLDASIADVLTRLAPTRR